MRRVSTKWIVVVTVGLLALGGAALAYWSSNGTGTTTATTGTTTGIVVNQTNTVTALAPGLPAQALAGNFDNTNEGPVRVGSVVATVTGTNVAACDATNYTIAGTAVVNAEIPAGTAVGSWSGLTIQFNNKAGVNQDVCKGATVNIGLTSN